MKISYPFLQGVLLGTLMLSWFILLMIIDVYSIEDSVIHQANQSYSKIKKIQTVIQQQLCGEFTCFSGDDFVRLFETKTLDYQLSDDSEQYIVNPQVDEYLNSFAESLGYKKRSFVDESQLVDFNTLLVLPEIRDSYLRLRNKMSEDGISLHLVSAYRDFDSQKSIFLKKLGLSDYQNIIEGFYDEELSLVFEKSALPGYSKHHTGYAVDFGCGNKYLVFEFEETECYQWMSENNFEPIKEFGFIPSYPNDVKNQGPQPEPWEYVWVGIELLK